MTHPFFAGAKSAFDAGVAAADPYTAVQTHLPLFEEMPLVIAVGKAAVGMIRAALDILGPQHDAIVVTNPENAIDIDGVTMFAAGHPIPDEIGMQASKAIIMALQKAQAGRPVLCLISGGGSALLPAPKAPVTLADKAAVNKALLASGADIVTINMVRQQLSDLKGGGLLQYAKGPVSALILSDVIGDDLRAIASGPTVRPIGSTQQAREVCIDLGIWDNFPASVKTVFNGQDSKPGTTDATNTLVGSNSISVDAMAAAMPEATHHTQPLVGNVTDAARWVSNLPVGKHVFGGETTVTLTGSGKGGRNQDMALRVALLAEAAHWQQPWLYLQGGTDGRDGPTDAAGGIVHDGTLSIIRANGINPQTALDNNDAYTALMAGGALLMTGGTGTNVADIGVLIRG